MSVVLNPENKSAQRRRPLIQRFDLQFYALLHEPFLNSGKRIQDTWTQKVPYWPPLEYLEPPTHKSINLELSDPLVTE